MECRWVAEGPEDLGDVRGELASNVGKVGGAPDVDMRPSGARCCNETARPREVGSGPPDDIVGFACRLGRVRPLAEEPVAHETKLMRVRAGYSVGTRAGDRYRADVAIGRSAGDRH